MASWLGDAVKLNVLPNWQQQSVLGRIPHFALSLYNSLLWPLGSVRIQIGKQPSTARLKGR